MKRVVRSVLTWDEKWLDSTIVILVCIGERKSPRLDALCLSHLKLWETGLMELGLAWKGQEHHYGGRDFVSASAWTEIADT